MKAWRWLRAKLLGPDPRRMPPPAGVRALDWCCVCHVDLFQGEVWERRVHFANEAEMGAEGGSWAAQTFCEQHAPADAKLAG